MDRRFHSINGILPGHKLNDVIPVEYPNTAPGANPSKPPPALLNQPAVDRDTYPSAVQEINARNFPKVRGF